MPYNGNGKLKEKKLVLVYPTFPSGLFASVSPGLLAVAAHAARHDPELIARIWDERLDGEFDPSIAAGALVGITTMTAQAPRAKRIAERAKEAGATGIVFGGIHPTVCPAEFKDYGAVVRGEIEGGSFDQVLSDYLNGRPLAQEYQTPLRSLENLPLAPQALYDYAERMYDHMISDARGCPLGCSYCSIHIISGNKIRHRPLDDIITEMRARKFLDGTLNAQITFTNDAFGFKPQDKSLLARVRAELDGKAFKWLTQIGLRPLGDEGFLELVNSVGTSKLIIGVESPFRDGLANEKNGIKDLNPAAIFDKVRRYPNIHTRLLLMLGFDFEPSDAFERMLEFIKQVHPDGVYISILTPFPGTKIGAQMEAERRLYHKSWGLYDTRHLVFERHYQRSNGTVGVMPPNEFAAGFLWLIQEAESEMSKWSRFAQSRVL